VIKTFDPICKQYQRMLKKYLPPARAAEWLQQVGVTDVGESDILE